MTTNTLVADTTLKAKLTDRVREALFDLLPEETIKKLIDNEINSFFEEEEKFEIEEIPAGGYYAPKRLAIHTNLTPFRRLIRVLLWEQIKPLVKASIEDVDAEYKRQVTDWFGDTFRGEIEKPMAKRIDTLALHASKGMALSFVAEAAEEAKRQLITALEIAAYDTVPNKPFVEKLKDSWPIKPNT